MISGGTHGIGFAVAKLLVSRGADVVVSGRSQDRGDAALSELEGLASGAVHFVQGDASHADGALKMVQAAADRLDGLTTLISAGGGANRVGLKPFASYTPDELLALLYSQVLPRIFPVHAAIPFLRKSGGGEIVMLTTDAARHATPGESMVGGGGAQIMMLTKVLARELSRERVRVNAVALTVTSGTPGWDRVFARTFDSKVFSKALERFPFGRPPNVDEVAETVAFLASDAAAQISGQTVSVNGALSFGGW